MAVQRDKVIANAEKLVAKGKIEPAIKEYERLLEDNPNDVNTLNRIGDLWVRINRNDEAVKTFGKIADHYSKDGFFLKAIAIYKKINKLDPSKLEIYAKLADLYAKQGLAMEAKSQYQVLADYYLKHGDPGNALTIYRKISELDPNSINVHVKLADLHSQVGHTAEALKEYDRVGRMLLKRGMLDEAVQVFKKALKIDAKNVELVESLVTALIEAKDFDNAKAIVEQALETNRDNPRLLAMWGRILIGKGDVQSARSALERGLKADANDPLIRETLADLYLKQGDANRALDMLGPVAERNLGRGERGVAVEMLKSVLRVDPGHIPTLERLVATYTRLNEETNILSSMNSLAEAHIAKGQYQQASAVLEKLIEREPQNAQHRTKLQFVRSQTGETAAAPPPPKPKPKTAPDIPIALEIEEPVPTFDDVSTSLDLESTPSVDLDFSEDSAAANMPSIKPAVELAAMEMEAEAGDDLDFITEHLTEAEVFAKYGLAEKATEHLRAVLDRSPRHLAAHDRLFRILLDEGDVEAARTTASQYVGLLEEKGDTDAITSVRNEFLSRNLSLTPAAPRHAPPPPPPPAPEPEPVAEEVEEVEDISPSAAVAETDAMLVTELEQTEEISFDLEAGPSGVEIELEPPAPEPIQGFDELPEPGLPPEPEIVLEPAQELSLDEIPADAIPAEGQPFFGIEALAGEIETETVLPSDEVAEVDFYLEQELFDEARSRAENLLARFPGDPDLTSRLERINAAAAAAAAAPPFPQPEAAPLSRDEIESELLSAIPDDDEFGGLASSAPIPPPPPPPPAQAPAVPVFTATAPAQEKNLFADEDDFFDLAAELESELGDTAEEVVSLSEEEQSLEEIFKEFKKGVEQQLDSEDYDTHYNLGIAYKEMGLIDEAIGEFQLASKDPKRAVECASMLGLCFLEKGMPQLAIKWYRKGLEMAEITEEEHIGLLYDLGSAYVEVGDTENAQKAFMEVYGLNSNYRDIVSRIKQLEDARK